MADGRCRACRGGAHADNDEKLCALCWTSPYHTEKRRKTMAMNDGAHVQADGGGLRLDEGKPRVDLIPPEAMMELGKLYAAGAKKYADRNWERGMPWSQCLGPLMRHLFKWMAGERLDPETGLSHMTHVAWNAIALVTYELRKIGTDDVRPAEAK